MRKRSKYRAKPVLLNPLGYVIGGMAPVVAHDTYLWTSRSRTTAP